MALGNRLASRWRGVRQAAERALGRNFRDHSPANWNFYLPRGHRLVPAEAYRRRRRDFLVGDVDLSAVRGIEVGALDKPLVTRDEADILYMDYADADALRAHHRGSAIRVEDIVEVDLVWDGRPLRDRIPAGKPLGYVLASHMIEHAPNFLGWLLEMRALMDPGGLIGLVVPDKRHTFDVLRDESTLGQVLDAYLTGATRPSIGQVLDHCTRSVDLDNKASWETLPERLVSLDAGDGPRLRRGFAQARIRHETGAYVDAHCWILTPARFVELARSLAELELFPFTIDRIQPTPVYYNEFLVRLRSAGSADDPQVMASIERAAGLVADDVNERIYAERMRLARRHLERRP
jgi:hypothetical protein